MSCDCAHKLLEQWDVENETLLVLLSGGLGSVAVLHWLLTRTAEPIIAHHVHISAPMTPEPQEIASRNVVTWLKDHTRDFAYREAVHQVDMVTSDIHVCGMVAGHYAKSFPIAGFCFGTSIEDMTPASIQRNDDAVRIASMVAGRDVPLVQIFRDRTRLDMARSMPAELRAMTWSCCCSTAVRKGSFRRCGKCPACREWRDNPGLFPNPLISIIQEQNEVRL